MPARGDIVLADTNVLVELVRIQQYKAVTTAFRFETAGKCIEEIGTGGKARQKYVQYLRSRLVVHSVGSREMAALHHHAADAKWLDEGEKHLLAHAAGKQGAWWLCDPDIAALRVARDLRILDRTVALDALLGIAGVRCTVRDNFTGKWLEKTRTKLLLGII